MSKLSEIDTLAMQLWYSFALSNGTIQRAINFVPNANPIQVGAHMWMQMEAADQESWLDVAGTAKRLLGKEWLS